ncbi:MAG: AAA family ATPase [Methylovulum sp.]|nr:AAA family ATPase [Methylovulum sp.]
MAKIEGIRVLNFRGLKDVKLGKRWNEAESEALTAMTVVIGKNGVGKSTLFDVFGFLADALKFGVEDACDLRGRGGFKKIRSQGQTGAIEFEIFYREDENACPITYVITIDIEGSGRPFVAHESLFQHTKKKADSQSTAFLCLFNGKGAAYKSKGKEIDEDNEGFGLSMASKVFQETTNLETIFEALIREGDGVELEDKRKLGIATLGALKQHPRISAFRQFIEGWYLSYFTPDAARNLPQAGAQQHLNSKGDNLANVVQFMEREHREIFQDILNRIAEKIPGIDKIDTYRDPITNNLYLRFNDKGFQAPFYAPQMSDGTLKVFAYLLLLEDPTPPPFICIEEPENGLYHKLLETLAAEFRAHATGKKGGTQLFITTHQPYFVDALETNEVWVLEKGEDGFATVTRASEIPYVQNMVNEGLPLGGLWYSDYLDAR